ncbi:hypothetical protein, partial [Porphyromonas gingivalis]|uniref:hypothetical protein n=1 Tax=Porphyromonas gingivalis TaxID=837 RepID=UPI001F398A1B
FTHYRATKNEYEVLNPSHPKETGSNEATTTNHNTILMRHPCYIFSSEKNPVGSIPKGSIY